MALCYRGTSCLPLSKMDERHRLPLSFQLSALIFTRKQNEKKPPNQTPTNPQPGSVSLKCALARFPLLCLQDC